MSASDNGTPAASSTRGLASRALALLLGLGVPTGFLSWLLGFDAIKNTCMPPNSWNQTHRRASTLRRREIPQGGQTRSLTSRSDHGRRSTVAVDVGPVVDSQDLDPVRGVIDVVENPVRSSVGTIGTFELSLERLAYPPGCL